MSERQWHHVVDLAKRIDLVPDQVATRVSATLATWHPDDPQAPSRVSLALGLPEEIVRSLVALVREIALNATEGEIRRALEAHLRGQPTVAIPSRAPRGWRRPSGAYALSPMGSSSGGRSASNVGSSQGRSSTSGSYPGSVGTSAGDVSGEGGARPARLAGSSSVGRRARYTPFTDVLATAPDVPTARSPSEDLALRGRSRGQTRVLSPIGHNCQRARVPHASAIERRAA